MERLNLGLRITCKKPDHLLPLKDKNKKYLKLTQQTVSNDYIEMWALVDFFKQEKSRKTGGTRPADFDWF